MMGCNGCYNYGEELLHAYKDDGRCYRENRTDSLTLNSISLIMISCSCIRSLGHMHLYLSPCERGDAANL